MRIATTKVMNKNITALPKAVREALNIKPGDYIVWAIEDNKVIIRKMVKR